MGFDLWYFRTSRAKVTPGRCPHPVHDAFGVDFHTCGLRTSEKVGEFEFCRRHARMIRREEDAPINPKPVPTKPNPAERLLAANQNQRAYLPAGVYTVTVVRDIYYEAKARIKRADLVRAAETNGETVSFEITDSRGRKI